MPANNRRKEMDGTITFKVSKELKARAVSVSAETGVPVSFVLRKALEEWVKSARKQG